MRKTSLLFIAGLLFLSQGGAVHALFDKPEDQRDKVKYGANLIYKTSKIDETEKAAKKRAGDEKSTFSFGSSAGRTLDGILRELSESGVSAVGRSCANRFANNLGLIKGKGETNLLNYYLANLRNAESIINIISRESGTYTEGTKNQKRIDDAIEGVAKCLSEGTEKFAKKNERYAKIARIFEFATSRGNRMPQGGASTEPY